MRISPVSCHVRKIRSSVILITKNYQLDSCVASFAGQSRSSTDFQGRNLKILRKRHEAARVANRVDRQTGDWFE